MKSFVILAQEKESLCQLNLLDAEAMPIAVLTFRLKHSLQINLEISTFASNIKSTNAIHLHELNHHHHFSWAIQRRLINKLSMSAEWWQAMAVNVWGSKTTKTVRPHSIFQQRYTYTVYIFRHGTIYWLIPNIFININYFIYFMNAKNVPPKVFVRASVCTCVCLCVFCKFFDA